MQDMLTPKAKTSLEKQQYRVIGSHTAVKICSWTKSLIKDYGGCYKLKFYGIMSHQCMQMSPNISCANRCTFCWRDYKAPVGKEWVWNIDEPDYIINNSKEAHHKLLTGIKGYEKVNMPTYEASKAIKHVALSLTGEPIIYPKINELIDLFHQQGVSTFLVTNAQYPEAIKNLKPITQLYISLDAPTKELLKSIDKPLFTDYWERLNKSLQYMSEKKQRTCIRLTMIKNMNMDNIQEYTKLISKANPDFIEVKAYMYIGASRQRLKRENMPYHKEIVDFSKDLELQLPDYELVSEHVPSKVTLLAKKKFKKNNMWHTWIDFNKFNKLVLSTNDFSTEDYLKNTPVTGINENLEKPNVIFKVNETTKEIDFYKNDYLKTKR